MSQKAPFSQAEVERVCRALKAVGESVAGVERTPEGGFRVLTGQNVAPLPSPDPESDWRGRLTKWQKSA